MDSSTIVNRGSGAAGVVSVGKALSLDDRRNGGVATLAVARTTAPAAARLTISDGGPTLAQSLAGQKRGADHLTLL
ncbi:hypothetical protein DLREEDagr8_50060 [Dongia sp. agr-C8]